MTEGPHRILVCEDESIIALDIQASLIDLGYDVPAVIATGKDAIEKAAELRPSLILMDIQLKGDVDGIEAATEIRKHQDVPIVYLTANADDATVARARPTAPAAYLIKPFDDRELQVTIEMALRRHEVEQRLAESERWLSATLRSIGDAVIATNPDGRIVFMNKLAEEWTGWTADEAQEREFDDVVVLWREGEKSPADALGTREVGVLVSRNDGDRHVEVSTTPIFGDTGNDLGRVRVLHDVSEREAASEERERLLLELGRSNSELTQFAAVASHDLREPLRKIGLFGSRIIDRVGDDLDDRAKTYLGRMMSAADRMSRFIEDLLAFSQVSTKTEPFRAVDLGEVVADVITDLEARIEETESTIEIGELPTIEADPFQMRQLFQNLIGNAVKFHKSDMPASVHVHCDPMPAGATKCWIRFRDDGVGFDDSHADKMFRPFERLHGRGEFEGSGMGLAISKKIVDRHAGSIVVKSQPGEGAEFLVMLPLRSH